MGIEKELLKAGGVLRDAKLSPAPGDFPFIGGKFDGRIAQWGIGKASKKKTEVFFKICLLKPLDLPFWLQEHCPIDLGTAGHPQTSNLSIEEKIWLVEHIPLQEDRESYFSAQTDTSIREHFAGLSDIAFKLESGEVSLERIVNDFQRTSVRDYFKTLLIGLCVVVALIVLFVVFAINKRAGVGGGEQQLEEQTIKKGELQPAKAVRKRRIVPSDNNVFLKVAVDKTVVPLNESVTLTYDLFTRYETRFWGFYNEGNFTGFQKIEKDVGTDILREMVDYEGQKFSKVLIGSYTLVPLRTGKQTIHPGVALVSVKTKRGEIVDMYLKARPIEITVEAKKDMAVS
ncbi:MAG TPA: BatD family protein [Candidatus Omnitrophota bacterium]|nr:BatD family protein [Candidatus Omnitrophota bacterium]